MRGIVDSEAEIRAINQAGEIGKANAPVINVTLPAGRVDSSYLTAAYTGPEGEVVFGGGEIPPGLRISPDGNSTTTYMTAPPAPKK